METANFEIQLKVPKSAIDLVARQIFSYKDTLIKQRSEPLKNEDGTDKTDENGNIQYRFFTEEIPNNQNPEEFLEEKYKEKFDKMLKDDYIQAIRLSGLSPEQEEYIRNLQLIK